MNGRQLRYLQVIAEEGNIAKASAALEKNPSTLTRVIKGLEQELTVKLFRRSRQGLVLTSEGQAVVDGGKRILELYDELAEWLESPHEWTKSELRYLLTVREHCNISRAAEELFIAQPSLSQMLLNLEEEIGRQIFQREKYGVRETEFGTELLNRLEWIERGYEELEKSLEEFRQMRKGIMTIGIPMNLGTYLLPMILPKFSAQYPGIEIRIRESNSRELEQLLLAKKIDFCIMHFDVADEQIQYEYFFEDPFCLVVPKKMRGQFPFSKTERVGKNELAKLQNVPFIMVARRQKLRLVVDRILEAVGVETDVRCTTKSMETAKRLVAAGMGVTILPRSYLELYSGMEDMESFQIDEGLNASWKMVMGYRKAEGMSRSATEFLRMLREALDSN